MTTGATVAVGLSGGVDSSVAAAVLKEQGYRVIGLMLRLWNEPGAESANRCCTPDAMALARRVAAKLGIPFYALDAQESFRQTVVQAFLDGHLRGVTPNPCIFCNRQIRWGFMLEHAQALGADFLATGHYARVQPVAEDEGKVQLLRGLDEQKDQSYVLSALTQEQLAHSLFPLGAMRKPEVRARAADLGLPTAARPDSQDLCFLGETDQSQFLQRYAPSSLTPGDILNPAGQVIGRHTGLADYTIGQRKGLGIASAVPLYVIGKELAQNTLVVGPLEALGRAELTANQLNWIGQPPREPIRVQAKIRYKASPAWANLTVLADGRAHLTFDQPLRDITAGQRVVFYEDEVCLGGGTIE